MILELSKLNKRFDKPVLKDIDLEVEEGEIISILGKSGSGKSTLLFAYILVFVSIVKELPMTLVLRPFNYETLSTKTYTLANAQMLQQTSVYAFFIIVVSLVPLSILLLKRFR